MNFHVGDILSVSLAGHTRHFFVYIGDSLTVGWGPKSKKHFLGNVGQVEYKSLVKVDGRYFWRESNKLKKIILERRTNAPHPFNRRKNRFYRSRANISFSTSQLRTFC